MTVNKKLQYGRLQQFVCCQTTKMCQMSTYISDVFPGIFLVNTIYKHVPTVYF